MKTTDINKNVPELRFPEFEGEWGEKKLGSVSEIRTGPFGSLLHEKDYVSNGTPIITVEHLGELGLIHKNMPLISDEDKKRLKGYVLKENDIVFSRVGSVDRNSIVNRIEDGWLFSGRLLRIRTDAKKINSKFLSFYFQLEYTKHRIRSVAVGQTMPSLNTEILKSFTVEYPAIPEQQKIATFLTAVDKRIHLLTQKKEKLEHYKKGVMQKLFSRELRFRDENGNDYPEWEERRLGEVLIFGNGKDYKQLNFGNIPVYGTGGCMTSVDDYLHDGESVCIGRKGTIDKPIYLKGKFWTVDTLFYTHSFKNVLPFFVFLYFQTINWKKYNEASGVPSLSKSTLEKISIKIPSLPEQQKIASFLSAIDKQIKQVARQIEHSNYWKKGLLQKMFV